MNIHEYTVAASKKYLRTVVFVDDCLFSSVSNDINQRGNEEPLDLSGPSDTANRKGGLSEQTPKESSGENVSLNPPPGNKSSDSFSPQQVIAGFAQLGVVCGLYPPQEKHQQADAELVNELLPLCNHSDVFILDWKLHRKMEMEDSPIPGLLTEIVIRDLENGNPAPIRFCAIYTDLDPDAVCPFLRHVLRRNLAKYHIAIDDNSYCIHLHGLTIHVYGKAMQHPNHVDSANLAERILQDFVAEYEGIISATALRGIAEVRDNAKRILDKFPPALDYALMVHGGLTVKNPTVPEDMQELLADEIRSILSEPPLSDEDLYGMFYEKADKVPPDKFRNVFPPTILTNERAEPEEIKSFFCNLLKRNDASFPNPFVACNPHDEGKPEIPSIAFLNRLLKLVKKVDESKTYSEGDLSQLFCYRTVYGNTRILKFGTIVRAIGSERRYVCMMPSCDCVRLEPGITEFPFWELTPVDFNHKGHAHGAIVTDEHGRWKTVCVKGKICKKMRFWKFYANGEVKFEMRDGKFILFAETDSENKPCFEWVAELKPLHAQRMAEYVSRQFSRVGLAESEWLRLQVDR